MCIRDRSDGKTRYVAYRDSPTTELLQEALGGRAKAAWLAHLIPGKDAMEYENNRQTLQMTQRVLQIRNRPQRPAHEPLGLASDDTAEGGDARGARREGQRAQPDVPGYG